MPNGGPNCTSCNYNRPFREWQKQKMARAAKLDFEEHRQQTAHEAFCLVHGVAIENPYWTCCKYGHDGWDDEIPKHTEPSNHQVIRGVALPIRDGDAVAEVSDGFCESHPSREARLELTESNGKAHLFCGSNCYFAWLGRPHDTG